MSKHRRTVKKRQSGDSAKNTSAVSIKSIAEALEKLHFKKSLFGVNERDVWTKIRRLDEMYRTLYREQEIKYRALIKKRDVTSKRASQEDVSDE